MEDRLRFYLDEHVSLAVGAALRRRGIDVIAASEANMLGAADREHLQRAIEEGRVLVTFDSDFVRLHREGVSHAGIVFFSHQTTVRGIIRSLVEIHDVLRPQDMVGQLEFT